MNENTTPMMKQWFSCKKKAKDALLFFRLGDFYEAFYEDAKIISKEINLTLTKRQNIPMCGVPFHTCETYVDKLIEKGFKIAIAEQMEDAKGKKTIVKRDVVRIISPGTIINSSLIKDKSNNFFASISQVNNTFSISFLDLTTSEFRTLELETKKELKDELYKIKPSEILISQKFHENTKLFFEDLSYSFKFIINVKENWHFNYKQCYEILISHFKIQSLDGFGLKKKVASIISSGALIEYLKEELVINLDHIKKISTENNSSYMAIDHACFKNLEITESLSQGKKKNTLLEILDFTLTPMGGRLLKNWIKHPLIDPLKIKKRQDAVEELLKSSFSLEEWLENIKDIERMTMKIKSGFSKPKDLIFLKISLENILHIREILSFFNSSLIKEELKNIKDLSNVISLIKNSIVEDPPTKISDGNVIKENYNKELDEIKKISKNAKLWIANYQQELKEKTKIKNLKVGFNKIFGYYIEISKGQINKILPEFQRKQTLVNSERFVTEKLKSFEHKILTAEEKSNFLETKLYNEIKKQISLFTGDIFTTAKAVAKIDLLNSFSVCAKENKYIRPEVENSSTISIKKGRHPILENNINLSSFVANDTFLDKENNNLLLITGPNMAGKSTYIRQVALIVILAQMGSFIPAKEAKIGVVDKIFSRIGANDDLNRGQSTFMVEMTETANILNNATNKSLVVLDEIGRGTSTYDGIAIAWAVAKDLSQRKIKTLFATHFSKLTKLEKKIKGAVNYHIQIKESSNKVIFLRKIEKGYSSKSFGIHVAKLAGIPQSVIKKAEEMLNIFNIEEEKKENISQLKLRKKKESSNGYPLFSWTASTESIEILDEIKKINPELLSPMQALEKLFEIKAKIKN